MDTEILARARPRVRINEATRERIRIEEPKPAKRKKAKANRTLLTEDKVAALPGKQRDYQVWDAGGRGAVRGLCVHVLPSGTKTYRYSFRFKGAPQAISYKVGRWPGMSLEEARAKAVVAEKEVAKGRDPRVADPSNSDNLEDCLATWHKQEQVGRLANKSADETKSFVRFRCKDLLARPVGEIGYREIDDLLAKIRDVEKKPATALRLHAHLKTLFRWAVRTQRIEHSPIADMPPPAQNPEPRQRGWFGGEAAEKFIKALWSYADRAGGDEGKLLKLMLLIGKRRTVVQSMRWDQISSDWFYTPPKGSKSKRNNPIPVPKLVQRVLGPRPAGNGPVFGTRFDDAAMVALAGAIRKEVEPTYLHHGLRHLMATGLRQLKVNPYVARLVLDHAEERDVHSGYEHSDARHWEAEMCVVLEVWCGYVEKLVAPAEGVAVLR
jgi:integrase